MDLSPGQTRAARPRPCTRLAHALVVLLAAVAAAPRQRAEAATAGTLQARVGQARTEARNLASALQMRSAELGAQQQKAAAAAGRQRVLERVLARSVARARVLEARVTAAQE